MKEKRRTAGPQDQAGACETGATAPHWNVQAGNWVPRPSCTTAPLHLRLYPGVLIFTFISLDSQEIVSLSEALWAFLVCFYFTSSKRNAPKINDVALEQLHFKNVIYLSTVHIHLQAKSNEWRLDANQWQEASAAVAQHDGSSCPGRQQPSSARHQEQEKPSEDSAEAGTDH